MSERGALSAPPPGRSSIDPITNIAMLAPVRLEDDAGFLITGRLPRDVLPVYLHEATHHWCFFSPVGLALTLLNLRARRRALMLEIMGPPNLLEDRALDTIDVVDDYIRYDALTRVQTPLAEGLATFAEYDALPGSSSVATDVMTALARHFIQPDDPDDDVWEILGSSLVHERRTYRFASRKASLLMQGMELESGGYLAGYLTVKGLWRDAMARNRRLTDSDLFLNLFVTYLYWDFGLVAHLLDWETSDYGAATVVINYFVQRLRTFIESICDDWLDAVEDTSDRPSLDETLEGGLEASFEGIANLGTDPALWEAGKARLVEMLAELQREAADEGGRLEGLPRRQLWSLAERQQLVVGSLAVDVDINERGWVRVWGGEGLITAGPGVEGARARSRATGSLEIFLNPWRWGRYMAYVASVDGRPAMCWFRGEPSPEMKENFLQFQTDTAAAAAFDRRLAEYLEHQLQEDGTAQILIPELRRNVAAWGEKSYSGSALPALGADAREAVVAHMGKDGLLPILGLENVRALAWLSLNWPFHEGKDLESAFRDAAVFHEAPGDVWTVVADIAERSLAALGEPLVTVQNGHAVCSV
jgi:hypothetical protein